MVSRVTTVSLTHVVCFGNELGRGSQVHIFIDFWINRCLVGWRGHKGIKDGAPGLSMLVKTLFRVCFLSEPSVQGLLRCSPLQTQMSNLMSCHGPKHITHVGWCIGNSPQWPSRNCMMVRNRAAHRLRMWNAECLPAVHHNWCHLFSILSQI